MYLERKGAFEPPFPIMEALIAFTLFLMMGFGSLFLSKNEALLERFKQGNPKTEVARLMAKFAAIFSFILSALCLSSFVAQIVGLVH